MLMQGKEAIISLKKKIYQRESKRFRRRQINNPPQKATAWAQNYFHDQENQLTIQKYKTFATRCKPLLITSRPHKTLTHRISKRAYKVPDNIIFGQMKPRWTCTRMMGREKSGDDKQLMIWHVPHHLWNMWNCVACVYWWCDCSRMNSEVYRAVLMAQI